MTTWRFVLAEAGGGGSEILDLATATERSYSRDLLDGHGASFSLYSYEDDCQKIAPGAHDLKIYEDGRLRDRLRIISAQRSGGDGSRRTFTCVSYKKMLDLKKIQSNDTAVYTGYVGLDLEEAAWSVINTAQSRASAAGGNAFNIKRSGDGVGIPVGRTVTGVKYFDPGQSVREAIDEMSQTESTAGEDDSWEWDIVAEGDDLVFYCWLPYRGQTTPTHFFENANVLDFDEDFDFSNYANYVVVQGSVGTDTTYVLNSGGATAGTFSLTFNGYNTATVPGQGLFGYNISLALFTQWLESLPSIGQGNVTVTGPEGLHHAPNTWTITFSSRLARRALPALTMTSSLTGGTGESLTLIRQGSRYTAQVYSTDYDSSPYGVIEYYHFDDQLTDMDSINERAFYLLRIKSTYTPNLSLVLHESEGTSEYDIGDFTEIQLKDIGYEIDRDDLRIISVDYSVGDDGQTGITVSVSTPNPIDRTVTNISRRMAETELAAKNRSKLSKAQKIKAKQSLLKKLAVVKKSENSLRASEANATKFYTSHGDRKINSASEVSKVNSLAHKITDNLELQKALQDQIRKLS